MQTTGSYYSLCEAAQHRHIIKVNNCFYPSLPEEKHLAWKSEYSPSWDLGTQWSLKIIIIIRNTSSGTIRWALKNKQVKVFYQASNPSVTAKIQSDLKYWEQESLVANTEFKGERMKRQKNRLNLEPRSVSSFKPDLPFTHTKTQRCSALSIP